MVVGCSCRGLSLAWSLFLLSLGVHCATLQHPPLAPDHTILKRDTSSLTAAGDLGSGTPLRTPEPVENTMGVSRGEEAMATFGPLDRRLQGSRKLEHQLVLDDGGEDLGRLYYNSDGKPRDQAKGALELPQDQVKGALELPQDQAKGALELPQDQAKGALELPTVVEFNTLRSVNDSTSLSRSWLAGTTQQEWGSHPLPPLDALTSTGGARWVAYFHDQAIAAVLQAEDGTVLNCTVQEVIEVWEQREARRYLGQAMPLVPVPLPSMVHLIALCGTINRPPPATQPHPNEPFQLWWLGQSALQGILPGTLWCGKRDMAPSYHRLGQRVELDACCRDHDHCPVKLPPLTTRYGVTSFNFATRSHCICDLEFLRCLKAVGNQVATAVGNIYFNLLQMECLQPVSPKQRPTNAPLKVLRPPVPQAVREVGLEASPGTKVGLEASPGTKDDLEASSGTEDDPPEEGGSAPSGGRLDCTRRERDGSCRMWLQNPKGFTQRYIITRNKLVF